MNAIVETKVIKLYKFPNLEQLYKALPLEKNAGILKTI